MPPEMLADPSLGACCRMREGCGELGPYKPLYQSYVCAECLKADQGTFRALASATSRSLIMFRSRSVTGLRSVMVPVSAARAESSCSGVGGVTCRTCTEAA